MRKRWTFDEGRNGFRYEDDAFRFTSEHRYARGAHDEEALTVRLGGRDGDTVRGMSGGWTKAFDLDEAQSVTLVFKVKVQQGAGHDRGEYADVRVALDGDPVGIDGRSYAARLRGDGDGEAQGLGWRTVEVDLGTLAAGRHDFTLGGYANRKSERDAFTEIRFDDVRLKGEAADAPDLGRFEAEVLERTNAFREKNGLDPVRAEARLSDAAEDWSREMASGDFFRHSDKPGQITEHGYDPDGWGENIAAGYATPKAVVQGWIDSPGHRKNLLRDDFEHIGIGYAYKRGDGGDAPFGHYWTQIFGTPADDYLL